MQHVTTVSREFAFTFAAFKTSTGMPYGTVNLVSGIPSGETQVTCTAGVGTFIVEFGSLSQLTGDPIFINVALQALEALWQTRSSLGLVGASIWAVMFLPTFFALVVICHLPLLAFYYTSIFIGSSLSPPSARNE